VQGPGFNLQKHKKRRRRRKGRGRKEWEREENKKIKQMGARCSSTCL
jgi:hypothetical protein